MSPQGPLLIRTAEFSDPSEEESSWGGGGAGRASGPPWGSGLGLTRFGGALPSGAPVGTAGTQGDKSER